MHRIVVGIDDSTGARQALTWAVAEARLRDAALEVVHVYDPVPTAWAYADGELLSASRAAALDRDIEDARRTAEEHAQTMVANAIGDIADLSVETTVVEGFRPAEELISRSANADLLVVGSRGRGGFAGLLLGSVSQQCATHAHCPVVIIREESDTDAADS
ncbi:MAG: universal stress protein [Nitriliruptoraceae bacterium]